MIRASLPLIVVAVAGLALGTSAVHAEPVIFTGHGTNGSSGHLLSAQVEFKMNASNKLEVTLTNTSTHVGFVPSDLLTAVFFDIAGTPSISSSKFLSAVATSVVKQVDVVTGSGKKKVTTPTAVTTTNTAVKYPGQDGGWRYASNTSSNGIVSPGKQNYGFGTAGMGIFGSGGGGQQFDYGIVNSTFNVLTDGNPGMKGSPFIKNSVTFTLSGLAANFDPYTAISNVRFQYGTSLSEPHFDGSKVTTPTSATPEPSSFALMGLGSIGLFWAARRRKKASAQA